MMDSYQQDVNRMVKEIGGDGLLMDLGERNRRVAEEFCELMQAADFPLEDLIGTARWVYAKNKGSVREEVGDVMNCLAALCTAHNVALTDAAKSKLSQCFGRIDAIRTKQAMKPKTFTSPKEPTP